RAARCGPQGHVQAARQGAGDELPDRPRGLPPPRAGAGRFRGRRRRDPGHRDRSRLMDGQLTFALLVALIGVALLFDFLNGLHDAANSIATVVSTRVLSPQLAVAWAAFFNFVAFLVFGLSVANTVCKGIVDVEIVTASVIF